MSVGYGVGAGVGFGTESTPGVGVAPTTWLDFSSESIQAQRGLVDDPTIYGDRAIYSRLPGLKSGQGSISFVANGSNLGRPLYYWNGNASGAYQVAALGGFVTAAPTLALAAGGSLEAAEYRFGIATVWKRAADGAKRYLPVSTVATITPGSGDLTATVSWAEPVGSPPPGWEQDGHIVFRSTAGGASPTMRAIGYVAEGVTTFSDDGTAPMIDTLRPYSATPYMHTYKKSFVPGQNPLPAFSTTVVKDNDVSERFSLCRANQFGLTIGAGDQPITTQFDILARSWDEVPNPVISQTVIPKMMSWQSQLTVDGEFSEIYEGFTVTGSNGCELVPGNSGHARYRDVGYGLRSITGTLSRGFEDHKFWRMMRDGCRFGLRNFAYGGHFDNAACQRPNTLVEAYPFEYTLIIDIYQCAISQAGGNVGGPGRITESINYSAQVDPSEGTDMRVRLINLTAGPYQ